MKRFFINLFFGRQKLRKELEIVEHQANILHSENQSLLGQAISLDERVNHLAEENIGLTAHNELYKVYLASLKSKITEHGTATLTAKDATAIDKLMVFFGSE